MLPNYGGLGRFGAQSKGKLGRAGDCNSLVEANPYFYLLVRAVGVADNGIGGNVDIDDTWRAVLSAVHLAPSVIRCGIGRDVCGKPIASGRNGSPVQRQSVRREAYAVVVPVAGLHQVLEEQDSATAVGASVGCCASIVADSERQLGAAGHVDWPIENHHGVDVFPRVVGAAGVRQGRYDGGLELYVTDARGSRWGPQHRLIRIVSDCGRKRQHGGVACRSAADAPADAQGVLRQTDPVGVVVVRPHGVMDPELRVIVPSGEVVSPRSGGNRSALQVKGHTGCTTNDYGLAERGDGADILSFDITARVSSPWLIAIGMSGARSNGIVAPCEVTGGSSKTETRDPRLAAVHLVRSIVADGVVYDDCPVCICVA